MSTALANPQIVVNNESVSIVPNSVTYTEGAGEQNMRAASAGGASVEQVFSENVETNFSMVKFSIFPSPTMIDLARSWKKNGNANVVSITGTVTEAGSEKVLRRTFNLAAILNDYDVNLGSDTNIEIEFKSQSAV